MSAFDLDSFLVELSEDAPCGDDLEYDPAFTALETLVLGKPEQQIGESVNEAEPPNWSAVHKDALDILGRTRDLRVAQILSEASLQVDGLQGLHNSFRLFTGFLENFWESVHPQLDPDDDNDPTQRINILNSLCDFERMIRPLNKVPFVESRGFGQFGLRDIQIANGRIPAPEDGEVSSLSEIQAAFKDCDPEDLKSNLDAADGCMEELQKMEAAFTEQLGVQDSPDLSSLQTVLKEIHQVIAEEYSALTGEDVGFDGDEAESGQGGAGSSARTGAIQSSQDVVRVLDLVCDYYRKQEPSSPIPILLNRAKKLVSKDFMEIMQDLAPDGVSQVEMFQGRDNEED